MDYGKHLEKSWIMLLLKQEWPFESIFYSEYLLSSGLFKTNEAHCGPKYVSKKNRQRDLRHLAFIATCCFGNGGIR